MIWGVLRDTGDAEDALQETLLRIFLSLPSYRNEGFKTWAARIAVRIAIDARRSRIRKDQLLQRTGREALTAAGGGTAAGDAGNGRQQTASTREGGPGRGTTVVPGHAQPAEVEALKRERQSRVRALVGSLPDGFRSVVRSYFLEDRPQKEIAARERLQVKSVESKLYRAKQWMRKHWKEEDLE